MPLMKRSWAMAPEGDDGTSGGGAGGADAGSTGGGEPAGGDGAGGGGDNDGGVTATGDGAGGDNGDAGGGAGASSSSEDWRAALPAELRDDPTIKNTPDINTAAKSLVEAQKYIGNAVRIPGENADQEQWDKFYQKLQQVPGVTTIPGPEASEEERKAFFSKLAPGSPEEYEFSFSGTDDQGNRKGPPDEVVTEFGQKAHELGLTNAQADALGSWMSEKAGERTQALQEAHEAVKNDLISEYGENGVEQRQALAKAVIDKFGKDDDGPLLGQALQDNPALVRILSEIGEEFGDAIDAGVMSDKGEFSAWSSTELEKRIDEIREDEAYMDPEHPRHAKLMQEYERLGQALYGRQQGAA